MVLFVGRIQAGSAAGAIKSLHAVQWWDKVGLITPSRVYGFWVLIVWVLLIVVKFNEDARIPIICSQLIRA